MNHAPPQQQTHLFAGSQAPWHTLKRRGSATWYTRDRQEPEYRAACGEYFPARSFRQELALVTCPVCRECDSASRQTILHLPEERPPA
jgi:hypothetical protein